MMAKTKPISGTGNGHGPKAPEFTYGASMTEHEKNTFIAGMETKSLLDLLSFFEEHSEMCNTLRDNLTYAQDNPALLENCRSAYDASSWKIQVISEIMARRQKFESKPANSEAPKTSTARRDTSADYIAALAELGYAFRMNTLDDSIEINGCRLSDPQRSVIRSQMRDRGFRGMDALEDAYTANAYANRYHPIQQYLAALKWNGKPNIATLANHFENPDKSFPIWIRRWLIGAVAKAFRGEQNRVLVLDGPQGKGKSTFARWLCPLPEYFIESPINPEDKDSAVRVISRWIWEVSELGSTVRRADREALKAFISQQTVTVRKAYGRIDMIKPAMASMIGTVNNENGILSDPTGSRRFFVCRIDAIDWSYTSLDVSQIWAEAYSAYRQGERWTLSEAEEEMARKINARYEVDDPIAAMVGKFFRLDKELNEWTSSLEIQTVLQDGGLRGTTRGNSMAIAAAMTQLGFEGTRKYVGGVRIRGYQGVTKK